MKQNVENDHEKKSPHVKSTNHHNGKAIKKAAAEKVGGSHAANHKGSTKAPVHHKDAKNHSPAKKIVHPHQAKGKKTHSNKKVEGSYKAKNVPH